MRNLKSQTLRDGFIFIEGPRAWEDGIVISDMHSRAVHFIRGNGDIARTVIVDDEPSGLGQLPNGEWLVVHMASRRLAFLESGKTYCDLAPLVHYHPNDMVTDRQGRSYIGSFGFNQKAGEEPRTTDIVLVEGPGQARVVADGLWFPNGMAILPGNQLIVAESWANRLSCFDIAADGGLSNRRTFAKIPNSGPDGICADEAGGIWVSCFQGDAFVRVLEGGEITDRIETPGRRAVACNLGGADRRTLFCLTAETTLEKLADGQATSRIETARVESAGLGSP